MRYNNHAAQSNIVQSFLFAFFPQRGDSDRFDDSLEHIDWVAQDRPFVDF